MEREGIRSSVTINLLISSEIGLCRWSNPRHQHLAPSTRMESFRPIIALHDRPPPFYRASLFSRQTTRQGSTDFPRLSRSSSSLQFLIFVYTYLRTTPLPRRWIEEAIIAQSDREKGKVIKEKRKKHVKSLVYRWGDVRTGNGSCGDTCREIQCECLFRSKNRTEKKVKHLRREFLFLFSFFFLVGTHIKQTLLS